MNMELELAFHEDPKSSIKRVSVDQTTIIISMHTTI